MSEPTANPFTPPTASIDAPPQAASAVALADRGQRFSAFLLDLLVALPAMVLFLVGGLMVNANKGSTSTSAPSPIALAMMGMGGLYLIGVGIYQVYLLSTRGQSLGKRWMAIKIVKLDGSTAGFVHSVLLRGFVNGLISAIPYVGTAYALVDVLMIFRDDRRCLHDLIASTRVVKA